MGWSSAKPVLFSFAELVGVEVLGTRKSFKGLPLSDSVTVPVGQGSGAPNPTALLPKGGGTHSVPELLVTAMSKIYEEPYGSEAAAVLSVGVLLGKVTKFTVTTLGSLPTLFTVPVVLAVLPAKIP